MTPADIRAAETGGRLPAFHTSFIGRERESAELLALLERSRLITLVGVGGIGKTRLALEVAREWLDSHPADAWFVDLSQATDRQGVVAALARAVLPESTSSAALLEAAGTVLAQGSGLLVLDNCEHLVEAAAEAVETLLAAAPGLRILATSRIPLGLAQETRYPVPPLGNAAAAVQLFRDRAAAMNRLPGGGDQALIEEVCAHLDGMPLAIELAAASTRALSLEEIRGRLGQALDLFRSPLRTAPDRQRSLRGAIAWSIDLLEPPERELFARLAVFSGGWTLEAAEGICSGDVLPAAVIPATLTTLVDHSLVEFAADSGRYRMLEPVREFAAELLGDAPELRRRHAEWWLEWLSREGARMRRYSPASRRSAAEDDVNIRAAVSWAAGDPGTVELALNLLAAVSAFWAYSGDAEERWAFILRVADSPFAALHVAARALAIVRGSVVGGNGDETDRKKLERIRLELPALIGHPEYDDCRLILARRMAWFGEAEQARELLRDLLEIGNQTEDPWFQAQAHIGLAQAAQHLQDWESHREHAFEARRLSRACGHLGLERFAAGVIADGLLQRGALQEAEEAAQELLSREEWGAPGTFEIMLMANVVILRGNFVSAIPRYKEAIRACLLEGDRYHLSMSLFGLGTAIALAGDTERGYRLLCVALATVDRLGYSMFPREREQVLLGERLVVSRLDAATAARIRSEAAGIGLDDAVSMAFHEPESEPQAAPAALSRPKLPAGLTEREAAILRLLCEGCTNREIAGRLVLSVRTVETHIFNVYTKTNTGGRAAATAWAIANGIYQPPR